VLVAIRQYFWIFYAWTKKCPAFYIGTHVKYKGLTEHFKEIKVAMKMKTTMLFALVTMAAGVAVQAEEAQHAAAQVVTTVTTDAAKFSSDEEAFMAKLTDQNRKSFGNRFSAEQRKAVMIAVKNGANADEAVQKMLAAKEMKDAPAVANAEKATAEKVAVPAPSVK
jgi:hypothetical protein